MAGQSSKKNAVVNFAMTGFWPGPVSNANKTLRYGG
jgi:hypothetical protein